MARTLAPPDELSVLRNENARLREELRRAGKPVCSRCHSGTRAVATFLSTSDPKKLGQRGAGRVVRLCGRCLKQLADELEAK